MSNRTESNSYTVIFAIIMVIVVGALLAGVSTALSGKISENVKFEKQQNILYAMGINKNEGENDVEFIPTTEVTAEFNKYIKNQVVIDKNGNATENPEAYLINMAQPAEQRGYPLFIGEKDGQTYYIIPLRGKGLWDAIWGYVSINKDFIIQGVFFDHKGETAGLGANIKERFFMDDFIGEHLLNAQGSYAGINATKTNGDPENKEKTDNEVDAIAGATLTTNGVGAMFAASHIQPYVSYIKNLKN